MDTQNHTEFFRQSAESGNEDKIFDVNKEGRFDAEGNNFPDGGSVRTYADLDLLFTRKPETKDVNILNNITAVKRSIRNLVFLNFYEKPFNPDIGSDIRATLFEPVTQLTAFILTKNIEEVIENYEPRARVISITALPTLDRNAYNVSLSFFVVNVPTELVDLTLFLERLR
tara:strand:- start:14687 stop:15199 length:513 start_codon:yes stop_codon:yes gene_type:complete